jgi:hypothetical protein
MLCLGGGGADVALTHMNGEQNGDIGSRGYHGMFLEKIQYTMELEKQGRDGG